MGPDFSSDIDFVKVGDFDLPAGKPPGNRHGSENVKRNPYFRRLVLSVSDWRDILGEIAEEFQPCMAV
jgi:hypothetical protein